MNYVASKSCQLKGIVCSYHNPPGPTYHAAIDPVSTRAVQYISCAVLIFH